MSFLPALDELPPPVPSHLWDPYLPLGQLTLLLSPHPAPASALALHFAAQTSRGLPLGPDSAFAAPPDPATSRHQLLTCLLSHHPASLLASRLTALEADCFAIFHVPPSPQALLDLPRFLSNLNLPDLPTLVIVDPLPPTLSSTHLLHLSSFARATNIALLCLDACPIAISPSLPPPTLGIRLLRSLRHAASFHNIHLLFPADLALPRASATDHHLLLPIKTPLDPLPPALGCILGTPVRWCLPEPLLPAPARAHPALTRALAFLHLALSQGPLPASHVRHLAAQSHIPYRTLQRAKALLHVHSSRPDAHSPWSWSRAPSASTPPAISDGAVGALPDFTTLSPHRHGGAL